MTSATYRFGDFRLDPATRTLSRGGETIALPSKAFDCIVYLIEHRDRAVGRDELIAAVWGKAELGDNVLGQTVLFARRALEDTGKEQHAIRTIVRYGYHWVAPVTIETAPQAMPAHASPPAGPQDDAAIVPGLDLPVSAPVTHRHRAVALRVSLALAAVALAIAGGLFWRSAVVPDRATGATAGPPAARPATLVLPATVSGDAEAGWARLGVMDLVADRLRAAGLAVVPSDNVVALARGLAADDRGDALHALATAAAAGLVVDARADALAGHWRVSLRTVLGREPPIDVQGESLDLLAAARLAGDRLAARLGGDQASTTPAAEPALEDLLQQVDAAMLSERLDSARVLLDQADAALRADPQLRFRRAQIDYQAGQSAAAEAGFADLVATVPAEQDPIIHARALHGLGILAMQRGDSAAALPRLDAAIDLLRDRSVPDLLGKAYNSRAGAHAIRRENAAALADFAAARSALEAAGDGLALAVLDANLGAFDLLRDRHAEAVDALDRAIGRFAAFRLYAAELNARDAAAQAQLILLRPDAALASDARLHELASQVADPQRRLAAELTRAQVLVANGRLADAQALLALATADPAASPALRARAAAIAARLALAAEAPAEAERLATEALPTLPDSDDARLAEQTWITLLRAQQALGEVAAAAATVARIDARAARLDTPPAHLLARLAAAEHAADAGIAMTGFEQALAAADEGRTPLDVLLVAQGYAQRLIAAGLPGQAAPLAERVRGFVDHDYEAALLQLRVYHALGQTAAWNGALARCRRLAGERVLPARLLVAP